MGEDENHQSRVARLAIEHLPDAVIMVDPGRAITHLNPAAEALTGYSRQEALGKYCGDVLRGSLCGERCPLLASLRDHQTVRNAESLIRPKEGGEVPVMISTSCLLGPEGELRGAVEVIKDLSDIRRAERERRNLLSMLAHDMKGPMTVIGGYACRLLRTATVSEKERGYLELIRQEVERLSGFVNEFLSYSRLEAGRLSPSFSSCNLEAVACSVAETFTAEARAKDISVGVNAPASPVLLEADSELLERAISNLLSNAIKFTEPGGRVTVETRSQGGAAELRVTDTGCGIPPEHLPYIFEPFNRGAATRPGTGLGLAIVEAVAKAHGGKVFVASEPGRGSTFVLRIPLSQQAAP